MFDELLEATLSQLRDLRARGIRYVHVSPDALAALTRPVPPRARSYSASAVPEAASPAPQAVSRPVLVELSSPSTLPIPESDASRPAGSTTVLSPVEKAEALAAIRQRALVCQKCPHLVRTRTQVVFGVGDINASLMFVGEAPGADEDAMGEPFVGRAGQLLTKVIQAMGFSRETVYIANVLKCRPDMPAGSRANRPPRPEEMDTCKPYLLSQIDIIQPRVLVALGATAVRGLLGTQTTIGSMRGRWQEFRGIPVMPTFHPSYLLRAEDAADRGYSEKRKTWEDMLLVLEKLGRPITDKMRGYFLKPPSSGS